jgi:hypothetical protein
MSGEIADGKLLGVEEEVGRRLLECYDALGKG